MIFAQFTNSDDSSVMILYNPCLYTPCMILVSVPTQVGTLIQVVTSVHLGRPT